MLLEGPAEADFRAKTVVQRQIQHPLTAREQRLRRQAQLQLAYIVGHRLAGLVQEDPLQLPARPAALLGQLLQRQGLIQVGVNVVEHPLDAGEMGARPWRRVWESEGACHAVVGLCAGEGAQSPKWPH
ncbi:hypothetical protein D3C77_514920 [compost metagenome]